VFPRILTVAVVATVGLSGCGTDGVKRACMQVGAPSSLVSGAALLRLDVYEPSVQCSGSAVNADAGAAEMSHSFAAGEKISLQVPPGAYTLQLTTFSDSAGTKPLGQGCTAATLSARANICFDLTLAAVPPPEMTPPTQTFDGGCDEIMSAVNCGACGVVCSIASDSTARLCADGACMYTCAAGHFDCNSGTGSDTDGCECPGNGCCAGTKAATSGSCQPMHSDGVGETYYDCAPVGTYTDAEALAACTAFATAHGGSMADCESNDCPATKNSPTDYIVCSDGVPNSGIPCYCWGYGGPSKGNVDNQDPDPADCGCPDGNTWPTWK
jgi:hypothetical protein